MHKKFASIAIATVRFLAPNAKILRATKTQKSDAEYFNNTIVSLVV